VEIRSVTKQFGPIEVIGKKSRADRANPDVAEGDGAFRPQ
jgi:hypothetical protein